LKKFEIILKVDSGTAGTAKYFYKTTYPGLENNPYTEATVYNNILHISLNLNDDFYPISSIFWGKDYSQYKCNQSDDLSKINIITDNNKLPLVIDKDNNVLKMMVPLDNTVSFGVSSLNNALRCPSKEFVFGKIVVLYTTESNDSEKIVATTGTRELFTHDNKYIGIY
jgi:hypothetical protein